jgi:hypothetical protein
LGNRSLRIILGALAGVLSYLIVAPLLSPWAEVMGALLIGCVPGLADRSLRRAGIGAIFCAGGWLAGSLVFGVWMDIGVGAWLFAGLFLGAVTGWFSSSWARAAIGMVLGLLGGAIGEMSRYATVLVEQLRSVDMQLILLLCGNEFEARLRRDRTVLTAAGSKCSGSVPGCYERPTPAARALSRADRASAMWRAL